MVTHEQVVFYLVGKRSNLEDWQKESLYKEWRSFEERLRGCEEENESLRGKTLTDEEILEYWAEQDELGKIVPY